MPRSWAYVLIKQQEMCTESSLLRLAIPSLKPASAGKADSIDIRGRASTRLQRPLNSRGIGSEMLEVKADEQIVHHQPDDPKARHGVERRVAPTA